MNQSVLCLLPPLVVLFVGFISRKVLLSLICGIVTATLVSTNFNGFDASYLILTRLWSNLELYNLVSFSTFLESSNLFICFFLLFLGYIITLVNHSGGANAYGMYMQRHLKNAKSTQTASLFLSLILFVDDYFSSLTTGNVMTPLTDRFKIPRAKIAFLVDSMAAPLAILCPFSSWFAAIIGFFSENGISIDNSETTLLLASPFEVYLKTIPFIFYSLTVIPLTFYIVQRGISFGLMGKHEEIAEKTGNLFGGNLVYQERLDKNNQETRGPLEESSLANFLVPIGIFVMCIIFGMVFSGGYNPIVGEVSFLTALQNCSVAMALFTGGMGAMILTTLYFLINGKITPSSTMPLFFTSSKMMYQTMLILMLAWTLGEILREDLSIGSYLASLIAVSVQINLLPALFFIISLLIAFAMGTSWGTAAVMLPISITTMISLFDLPQPANLEDIEIFFPVMGAIFSGCIAGDHLSPISDTTIMTSSSTKMPHIDHVQTQMGYAIPLVIVTVIGFIVAGYTIPYGSFVSLTVSMTVNVILAVVLFEWLNKPAEVPVEDMIV
jgi:tetracycline resistance efflux pump